MAKLPSFQFYPGDWMKDPSLRACSLATRGLWIDMLCLMHESSRRGYLQHPTSNPVTAAQLARMTGCATDEIDGLLQELETAGVCSRTEHGTYYSRRMVRDENKRKACSEAGKKGGNPTLMGRSKGGPKGRSKGEITPSSSSSSSSSDLETPLPPKGGPPTPEVQELKFPAAIDTPELRAKWGEWEAYRRERRLPTYKPRSANAQLRRLESWGIPAALASIDMAIANAYQGLFEPRGMSNGSAGGRYSTGKPDRIDAAAQRRARERADEFPEPSLRIPIASGFGSTPVARPTPGVPGGQRTGNEGANGQEASRVV